MASQFPELRQASVDTYDPTWAKVRAEAEEIAMREPALGGFIFANVLNHDRLEDAICHRIAQRLDHTDVSADLIRHAFAKVLDEHTELPGVFRADLAAVADRDHQLALAERPESQRGRLGVERAVGRHARHHLEI